MINKINSVGNGSTNKISKSKINNKMTSKQTTFGMVEGFTAISSLAHYATKIFEIRKNKLFYKIFPIFNPEPKIVKHGDFTELVGESSLSHHDRTIKIEEMKQLYSKLTK